MGEVILRLVHHDMCVLLVDAVDEMLGLVEDGKVGIAPQLLGKLVCGASVQLSYLAGRERVACGGEEAVA